MVGGVKPALRREPAGKGGADQHQRRAGDPGRLRLVANDAERAADQQLVGPADPDSNNRGAVFPVVRDRRADDAREVGYRQMDRQGRTYRREPLESSPSGIGEERVAVRVKITV
jgi:hypothetical protein